MEEQDDRCDGCYFVLGCDRRWALGCVVTAYSAEPTRKTCGGTKMVGSSDPGKNGGKAVGNAKEAREFMTGP